MSAPVNVLEVMEETSFFLRTNTGMAPGWRSTEVENARAAVAGLIEAHQDAVRAALLMHDANQHELVCIPPAEWMALTDAMRRVKGGVA